MTDTEKTLNEFQGSETPVTNIVKDDNLDVFSLLKTADEETPKATTSSAPPEKSAMEKAREAKQLGAVIDNSEYTSGDEPVAFKDHTQNPETEAGVQEALEELDRAIAIAEKNPVNVNITDPQAKMDMINNVFAEAEKMKDTGVVPEGIDLTGKGNTPEENDTNVSVQRDIDEPVSNTKISREKERLVEILIDKTGFGSNIELTPEERAKVSMASRIKITEVDTKELQTLRYNKVEGRSFLGSISEYESSPMQTPITLPASRYKCSVRGLSFGELSDIAIDHTNATYDQLNKKFSTIYNNITNVSIGKFKSYDDFLKNTAYVDMDMFVFGMACSTLPEDDSVAMTCRRKNCKKEYEHGYSPRGLINWESMDERLLKAFEDVSSANTPEEAKAEHEKSSIKLLKTVRMPESNIILEIGWASAYDYLHGLCNLLLGDEFKKKYPEDVNSSLESAALMLTVVRSASVPRGDGEYDKYLDYEDIIQILVKMKANEFAMVAGIMAEYARAYSLSFVLKNVNCPHCGAHTDIVPISINDLVFTKFQALGATDFDLSGIVTI